MSDLSSFAKAFGRVVKERRGELDATQTDLAERSALDRSYISDIERGQHNPTLAVIERIARGLGTKPSVLLSSTERIVEDGEG